MIASQPESQPESTGGNPSPAQRVRASARTQMRTEMRTQITRQKSLSRTTEDSSELWRRRSGVILLALIAMAAYYRLRTAYDNLFVVAGEVLIGGLLIYAVYRVFRVAPPNDTGATARRSASRDRSNETGGLRRVVLPALCIGFPWLLDQCARMFGSGNGAEIVMLSSLAWGSILISMSGNTQRTVSLSVVVSGFLVLFTTFISDHTTAVLFVYVWIAVCLWWLLNNHWSSVQCLAASEVKSSPRAKWFWLFLSVLLFIAVTGAAWDRVPVLHKLQAEIMPTSGGTSRKDSTARSGVGDGDALVAAQKHAASFGAVETDVFLGTEKPSLFDLWTEQFGEPKMTERTERAQALEADTTESAQCKFAETNRSLSGNKFSVNRRPSRKRKTPGDLHSNSLMYWEGAAGVRLATERYHHFDGTNWVANSEGGKNVPPEIALKPIEIEERTWFAPASRSIQNSISPFVDSVPEAIKFTRFRSPEIPARAGTQLWSIDKITKSEFFAYTEDDCLYMPDRLHVPDYTVVRFVNSRIDLERLEGLLRNCAPGKFHRPKTDFCEGKIAALAHEYSGSTERGLPQVTSVIDGLRRDFVFAPQAANDETDDDANDETNRLQTFLKERQGPSFLFATTAALMLNHLGYETRLVTGFYVSPDRYSASEDATAILPEDAHAWVEINVGHGYWIPLEPTPGFRKPELRTGLWYVARKNWKSIAIGAVAISLCSGAAYLFRSFLFACLCRLLSPVLRLVPPRSRLAWLCWMLDIRGMLIGRPRTRSTTHRKFIDEGQWELDPQGRRLIDEFLTVVDHVRFGKEPRLSPEQRSLTHSVLRHIHRIKAPRQSRMSI